MKKLFLLASFLMAFGISADAGDITSPNGQIKVNFTLDGTVPTYSVTYQGKTIIKPSRLGYQLAKGGKDGKDLLPTARIMCLTSQSVGHRFLSRVTRMAFTG